MLNTLTFLIQGPVEVVVVSHVQMVSDRYLLNFVVKDKTFGFFVEIYVFHRNRYYYKEYIYYN